MRNPLRDGPDPASHRIDTVERFLGMVQIWVTLGRVKPSAAWPESIALALLASIDARPYIEKCVTLVNRI